MHCWSTPRRVKAWISRRRRIGLRSVSKQHLSWFASRLHIVLSVERLLVWIHPQQIAFRFIIDSYLFLIQFISETGEAKLSFHKNGRSLGVAFHLNSSTLGGQALYPHVLCKNCSVSVNLNPDTPWHPFPAGFCTLLSLPPGQRTRALLLTASKSECEVGERAKT